MRVEGWKERLWETIAAAERREFFFGACVRLSAECVDAITGSNHLEGTRALYRTHGRALRTLQQQGGDRPLAAMISAHLGEQMPRNLLRVGDLAYLELPTGPAVGVVVGHKICCAASPAGVAYQPLAEALFGWRVD